MNETWYATIYGRTIAIEASQVKVALPFLPLEWTSGRPENAIDRTYHLWPNEQGRFELAIDDATPIALSSVLQLEEHIESDLHHWLATYTRGFLFVHAGCVSWRDRAIVLPGRSHAGKTTLTRALVETGATYYSDDYAVVDPTGSIWPFPRRLYVRPITADPPHRLDPVASDWPIGRTPIRAIVVAELRFDRKLGWAVEQLSHGQGALSLLDNTVAARERPEDSLRMMANVMDGAVPIKGTRDTAEASARRLLAMVDELMGGEAE